MKSVETPRPRRPLADRMVLFRRRKMTAESGLKPALPGEGRDVPIRREELVVLQDPGGQIAEQVRRLRNAIHTLNTDGAPRSVMVTSPVQGDGKSVLTMNLAIALAELPGLRVLVVDGDMYNPSVEDLLGLPRRQGWTEVLQGRLPLDQAVRQTSVDRLQFIGPGAFSSNPNEIINVDRIRAVFEALKRRNDYVLIDSPAVLALNHPALIGAITDGILLVVRRGVTPKPLVEEALQMLEAHGGNVLGTVLTNTEEPDNSHGY